MEAQLFHIRLLNFIKEVQTMEEIHFYYAQIDENNICVSVLDTPVEITDNPKRILTDSYDMSVLGKKYNNGVWERVETTSEYTPTETELIQAELLLNQQEIIIKQNEHDEVLAAILLGQQTV